MNWTQAKIIMMSGLPVRRQAWPEGQKVAAGRDREVGGVVWLAADRRWEPSEEDQAASDWTLAVG